MIKKFKTITDLAVFKNFEWDKSVLDSTSKVLEFKQNNIIYGRNYSGKTTLSRIVRAMETGVLSDKYVSPSFCVELNGSSDVTPGNLKTHGKTIRVFNDDFVRENLKFIVNPNEHIESFAILGDDNYKIEMEIKDLESKLGNNEEEKETCLFLDYKNRQKALNDAVVKKNAAESSMESRLTTKATDKTLGIKYQIDRFGDQNYNIVKLRNDITTVLANNFSPIDEIKEKELGKIIEEKPLGAVTPPPNASFMLLEYSIQAKHLLEKKIIESGKIENLLKDAIMNRWVKDGFRIHKDKFQNCGFCGNTITSDRWGKLDRHFDEESSTLETLIRTLLSKINTEIESKTNAFKINISLFYSNFHERCKIIQLEYDASINTYLNSLNNLKKQLISRQEDLLNEKVFEDVENNTEKMILVLDKYQRLCSDVNSFSERLLTEKSKAQNLLRLKEVHRFVLTINYQDEIEKINQLKATAEKAKRDSDNKQLELKLLQNEIESKKRLLNDEKKGAIKVNEYLNNYFGHKFLSLCAIEQPNAYGQKQIRFEVVRDGKKAHHLSEGESSLIAFCYFMAKLHDVETKSVKPIIWIDDPISSLDGNHVFFIYSLINKEIVSLHNYEQLFISTHNLDFLKYLKRLPGAKATNETKSTFRYLVIQRDSKYSSILLMPKYLCDYITEFNFLFEQIYKCATITKLVDENHGYFYNFGNNARKFLEVFLYYKFPDNAGDDEKYKRFFGNDLIPATLTDRINNEYSHLCGVLERGALPIDVPEMNSIANLILNRIKALDEQQYNALLRSIGVTIGVTP